MRNSYLHFSIAVFAIMGLAALGHVLSPEAAVGGAVTAMAVVQSSYSENIARGVAGQIISMTGSNVDSRNCETSAGIGFGLACSQGTYDKGAKLGAAAAANFVGLSVRDVTLVAPSGGTVDVVPQNANLGVMTQGDMLVTVGGNVAPGNDVTFNSTTGVLSSIGTGGSQFAIAGARWMTTASSGGLAVVRLTGDLPSA